MESPCPYRAIRPSWAPTLTTTRAAVPDRPMCLRAAAAPGRSRRNWSLTTRLAVTSLDGRCPCAAARVVIQVGAHDGRIARYGHGESKQVTASRVVSDQFRLLVQALQSEFRDGKGACAVAVRIGRRGKTATRRRNRPTHSNVACGRQPNISAGGAEIAQDVDRIGRQIQTAAARIEVRTATAQAPFPSRNSLCKA